GALRRPGAMDLDDECAGRRVKARLVAGGRLLFQRRGILQVGGLRRKRRDGGDHRDPHEHRSHECSFRNVYTYKVPSPASTASPPTLTPPILPLLPASIEMCR